jgi:hypothetical protein
VDSLNTTLFSQHSLLEHSYSLFLTLGKTAQEALLKGFWTEQRWGGAGLNSSFVYLALDHEQGATLKKNEVPFLSRSKTPFWLLGQ